MISFSVNFFLFCYFIPITWEKLIATDSKCQFRPNFIKNLFLPCFQVNILNSKMDKENNSFFCIKFEFWKHYIWKNVRKVLYSQTYIYWPKSMTFETLKSSSIKRFKYVSSWSIHWSRRFFAVSSLFIILYLRERSIYSAHVFTWTIKPYIKRKEMFLDIWLLYWRRIGGKYFASIIIKYK